MTHTDFQARAHQALLDAGFHPDFSPQILREAAAAPKLPPASQDLCPLLWSSIDNDNSRDLDQVEYVETISPGCTRLLVGIADVDAFVPAGSATDQHAAAETTSVYAGTIIFPMLPDALSTDRTSLLPDQDRAAIVIEMHIRDTGEVACHDVYPATLRNRAKLAYRSTGAWLEGRGPIPAPVANVPGMEAQLRLQLETSKKLRELRRQQGALVFTSREAVPVVENGVLKSLAMAEHNAAEDIIESFMVAANVSMAQHLKDHNSPSIRRVVKTPKRWDRIQAIAGEYGVKLPDTPDPRALSAFLEQRKAADPLHFPDLSLAVVKMLGAGEYIVEPVGSEHEGHFGLAVRDYAHSTAPNRRYVDLVTQRLLKSVIAGLHAPYSEKQLADAAQHCTERENAAKKVERLTSKILAANLLQPQIGKTFDALVTGASDKGTYVRLLKFPAEGKVIRGAQGLDVGDKTSVRLAGVDINRGFIDFERR